MGYTNLNDTQVWRAGSCDAWRRTVLPLIQQGSGAVFRRIVGLSPRPGRAPGFEDVPDFGAAVRVPGLEHGTVVNAAPLKVLGARGEPNPASSYRFEYITGDSAGRAITATGAALFSSRPWRYGTRPVIAMAPSTQGVAQHCDPSHTCAIGLNAFYDKPLDAIIAYELPVILWFLAHGLDVVFTDYPRDPIAGIQYYCDSITAAKSLLDAVLASYQLGLSPEAPLGLWGFSQGGGATGWAAQLPDYAPTVRPQAAVVGAPPVDLFRVLDTVDGGLLTGVIAYAIAGLGASSVEMFNEISPVLNERGKRDVLKNITSCAGGSLLTSGYTSTASWTNSRKPLATILDDLPLVVAEFKKQKLGRIAPNIPVLLWGSQHDDVIPIEPIKTLRDEWSDKGAQLTWHESRAPRVPGRTGINHFGPYFRNLQKYSGWLMDRLV
ncbi:triacylglycerol lipase [Corynebacterium suranareeae]|uniref:Triacylglycerol lipase n=1 Tax=Corynebacterium suranareeae TaxID=2506452 RepID=A0A160PQG8_9CORY|nr:lipase family protein [Corynebacterium suranareeae]BAU95836.1 triacylglycerol lipase [Corynebacterium suranareeae]